VRAEEAALLFTATPLLITSVHIYFVVICHRGRDIGSPSTGMSSGLHILEVIFAAEKISLKSDLFV